MQTKIKPIGMIRSPYKSLEEIPRDYSPTIGEVIVFDEYEQGLQDVEGFSHLMILWIFHESKGYWLLVKPLYYEGLHGVFTTRHPNRPNPIAVTVVELLERRRNILKIKGIDAVDKTPVIDIKPYTLRDRMVTPLRVNHQLMTVPKRNDSAKATAIIRTVYLLYT